MRDPAGWVLRQVSESLGTLIRENVFLNDPPGPASPVDDDHDSLYHGRRPGDLEDVDRVEVKYHSPSDEPDSGQGRSPLILVYMYRVADNPYLINEPPSIVRTGTGFVRRAAPLAVDLSYMMVPYAQNAENELLLVSKLKRLFSDCPVLEDKSPNGVLFVTGNERLPVLSDAPSMEQIHQIWAGFPNKPYRLSLFYTVTPVRIPRAVTEEGALVRKVRSTFHVNSPTEGSPPSPEEWVIDTDPRSPG
ncbi:DUF4255 domain-containing protein [Sorangium sp. So ce124]|uniref:DUF4255 domain-containing protein n=1 Tax=Sorangium sp. So ce124 TaxID=3133280 RepID=UPI003F5DFA54